jgi:hypothetical protein
MASRAERTDTPIPITGERTEGRRSGHQKFSSTLGSDEEIGKPPLPPVLINPRRL